ncbi:MAG TPA: NADH-quinone oxidoreductase subunit C [Bacilli bacterium]
MEIETLRTERTELTAAYASLAGQGLRFLTMVASDEKECGVDRFVLRYFFAKDAGKLVCLETIVPGADPHYPSLAEVLPATSWYEREARDLMGVVPDGHPDPRNLIFHDRFPEGIYPLRKDFTSHTFIPRTESAFTYPLVKGEGVFEVPVGPIHAGVIEPGHFRFQVMGDTILHLETRVFFTHRGIEKKSENMDVEKGLRLAERICTVCNVSHAMSYAQAVEQIAGAQIPARAQYLRMLFAEMERLYNHVGDIGNICAGIGFAYGSNHGARLKEMLLQLNERMTGHRYLRGTIALGGVARDLDDGQLQEILRLTQEIGKNAGEVANDVLANGIAVDRYANTGVLAADIVRKFAAVGPAARASGVDVDARRDHPYAAYSQLAFEVPLQSGGDVLARFNMRALETGQSVSLINQIINKMPDGEIAGKIGDLPAYRYGIGITESPRGENVHFVMTGERNAIFRYRVRSAAYANWPVVPLCVPGTIVPDFPLINKSFELCYACCDR